MKGSKYRVLRDDWSVFRGVRLNCVRFGVVGVPIPKGRTHGRCMTKYPTISFDELFRRLVLVLVLNASKIQQRDDLDETTSRS